MDEPWFCYMLECSDGSLYVGIANNLPERLREHARGKDSEYTAKRLPVRLVWKQAYSSRQQARKREREIKGWSRKKKLELIQKMEAVQRKTAGSP